MPSEQQQAMLAKKKKTIPKFEDFIATRDYTAAVTILEVGGDWCNRICDGASCNGDESSITQGIGYNTITEVQ